MYWNSLFRPACWMRAERGDLDAVLDRVSLVGVCWRDDWSVAGRQASGGLGLEDLAHGAVGADAGWDAGQRGDRGQCS